MKICLCVIIRQYSIGTFFDSVNCEKNMYKKQQHYAVYLQTLIKY